MIKTYIVKNGNGNLKEIKVTAGNVVRVNTDNNILSFDIAVNKGKDAEPEFINRICVSDNYPLKHLVEKFVPGQQVFVVYSEKEVEKDGKTYKNRWLDTFWYGRTPSKKN